MPYFIVKVFDNKFFSIVLQESHKLMQNLNVKKELKFVKKIVADLNQEFEKPQYQLYTNRFAKVGQIIPPPPLYFTINKFGVNYGIIRFISNRNRLKHLKNE